MTIRRMIVADVTLNGSIAKRTIAFPIAFSRKRTSSREIASVLRLQLLQDFGPDLAADFSGATVGVYAGPTFICGVTFDQDYRAAVVAN